MSKEYDKGYKEGLWYGKVNTYGELQLAAFPPDVILPGYTIPDLMKIAIEYKQNELKTMITTEEVYSRIINSLNEKRPLSLVRLGDGEGIALAQGYCISEQELNRYDFLEYAGISVPDYQVRDDLAKAIIEADIIGIPSNIMPDFQPLVCKALQHNGININSLDITTANIHQYLFQQKYFKRILSMDNKIVIVGNKASQLAEVLRNYCTITGVITPINGTKDIPVSLNSLHNYDFNLLLVAAGIPAVIICSKAAKEFNCTALDIGHLANQIIDHKTLDFEIF